MVVFSVPTLTDSVNSHYAVAMDGLRQSVLGDVLGETGDVTYEVTITVSVSDDEYATSHLATYTYTVCAFDWTEGNLTYQVFPDEHQMGYNWKWNSWLGWYYTYGEGWCWSWTLDRSLWVYGAGTFCNGSAIYDSTVSSAGKVTWRVPTVAAAGYSFYAWDGDHWIYINPQWFPWAYSYATNKWIWL